MQQDKKKAEKQNAAKSGGYKWSDSAISADSEEEFLRNYRPGDYDRPSVTVDILVFTLSERGELSLLLIQRGNHPFRGRWALPGGFVNIEANACNFCSVLGAGSKGKYALRRRGRCKENLPVSD